MMSSRIRASIAFSLWFLAQILAAQPKVIVEGSVQDPHGAVIMGAEVTVRKARSEKDETQKTTSDSTGAFTFVLTQPGNYGISATADGYVEPSALEVYRGLVSVSKADGSGKPTVRRVRLVLYRHAAVRGRLVEVENHAKRPVVKQTVGMVFTRFREGQLTLSAPVETAVTDSSGVFVIEKLPPGDYFVQISPTFSESATAKPAEKPAKKVDRTHGYRRTYWPEDAESGYGRPIKVDSGANLDLGDIEVKKGPFFRISGVIEFGRCAEEEKYALSVFQEYGQAHIGRTAISLPCNTPFVIHNVSPGSYQLNVWVQGRPLLERENVRIPAMVSDEDVEFTVQARRPHRLQGKAEFPESFPREQRADFRVVLMPVGRMPFFDEATPVSVDEGGNFALTTAQLEECALTLQGLKQPYYVKQVSYNGSQLPGTIVTLDPYAPNHHIEITVSDRPGTVAGVVTVKGDVAPGTRVLVSRWPFVLKGKYPVFVSCRADEKGHYSQSGLSPGVYRVAAVSDSARWRIERREDAMGILSAGKEVEIAEGSTRSQDLEVNAW
jgi:hypothetical protein